MGKGVTATVTSANEVVVKGPKGELRQNVDRDIAIKIEGDVINIERPTDQIRHRALHGLYRSLVANMVKLAEIPLVDAVKMASLTPARIINIDSSKGSLTAGKDADVVIFDEDINIYTTIVSGRIVYSSANIYQPI